MLPGRLQRSTRALITATALLATDASTAEPWLDYYPDAQLVTHRPFPDEKTASKVIEFIDPQGILPEEEKQEIKRSLLSVMAYGFEFHPGTEPCPAYMEYDVTPCFRHDRIVVYDLNTIKSGLKSMLAEVTGDGCSEASATNPRDRVSRRDIRLWADVYGEKNYCKDTPLGEVKIDLDIEASGSLSVVIALHTEAGQFSDRKEVPGTVTFNPHFSLDIDSRVFGLISLNRSRLASAVRGALADPNFAIPAALFTTILGDALAELLDPQVARTGFGEYGPFSKAARKLDEASQTYLLDAGETELIPQADSFAANSYLIVLVENAYWPVNYLDETYDKKREEVIFVGSFKQSTMSWTVGRGESLASLAKEHYGNERFLYLLLASNPEITNPNLIRQGVPLQIPPLYEIAKPKWKVVRAGDNLWRLCVVPEGERSRGTKDLASPAGSSSVHLIFPGQIVTKCFVDSEAGH
jgi:hypothetical protein